MSAQCVAMPEKSTAVSVRANRNYIRALKVLASERGLPIADLVREALDKTLGESIEAKVLFFATIDCQNSQSNDNPVSGPGAA